MVIMDPFSVAAAFMLVQDLFTCLNLQIQLLYYMEEQRQMSARRTAILQEQLLLPPTRRASPQERGRLNAVAAIFGILIG